MGVADELGNTLILTEFLKKLLFSEILDKALKLKNSVNYLLRQSIFMGSYGKEYGIWDDVSLKREDFLHKNMLLKY